MKNPAARAAKARSPRAAVVTKMTKVLTGVREAVRGAGVGRHLKEMQRSVLARRGIKRVLWTFDPLQARNAHLNFNRLGVSLLRLRPAPSPVT